MNSRFRGNDGVVGVVRRTAFRAKMPSWQQGSRLMNWSREISPVGWYVGSYVIRFIALAEAGNDDSERQFLVWENTVLVKAADQRQAYDKIVKIALEATRPYKGGPKGIDVQWVYEGVTEILPVYEEIEDGCEIMWSKYRKKLRNLRSRVIERDQLPL